MKFWEPPPRRKARGGGAGFGTFNCRRLDHEEASNLELFEQAPQCCGSAAVGGGGVESVEVSSRSFGHRCFGSGRASTSPEPGPLASELRKAPRSPRCGERAGLRSRLRGHPRSQQSPGAAARIEGMQERRWRRWNCPDAFVAGNVLSRGLDASRVREGLPALPSEPLPFKRARRDASCKGVGFRWRRRAGSFP